MKEQALFNSMPGRAVTPYRQDRLKWLDKNWFTLFFGHTQVLALS
jgi:hypothetical protein